MKKILISMTIIAIIVAVSLSINNVNNKDITLIQTSVEASITTTIEEPTTITTEEITTEVSTTEEVTEVITEELTTVTEELITACTEEVTEIYIEDTEAEYEAYAECVEEVEAEPIIEEETEAQTESSLTYYGYKELTAYEWTGNPCADGVYPQTGYTVASNDSNLWHRWIYIDGLGTYYVHDHMADWVGSEVIDIYMGDVDTCNAFGRQEAEVYLID